MSTHATSHPEHGGTNSGPRTVKHAALIPLAILVVMAAFIGLVAMLFLFNTRIGAVALAAVAAGGILFTVSLFASNDRMSGGQKFVAVGAGVVPLLLGGLIAGGVIGGIADEDRRINVLPLEVTPEDAPIIAAENQDTFCFPDPETGEGCEPGDEWEFVPTAESDTVAFVFDNREAGVVHNVQFLTEEGGDEILITDDLTGPTEEYFESEVPLADAPEEFYFVCTLHPTTMTGTGTIAAAE